MVSSLATGTEATWQAVLAARSGISRITAFDTTGFPTKIAGEVRDFDPTKFMEKKEVRG
jgi:3-oxoacyl-[acyl-carrier-protein] synthase II